MSTPLAHRLDLNGASAEAAPAGHVPPGTLSDIGIQVSAALGMLAGLWVAISPWFITLQHAGGNANAVDLISGLAVAGIGGLALISQRGFVGLQAGSALLGIWLIIAGPILSNHHPVLHAMYWSNSWAGGALIAFAAASLATAALRGARR
jgi:hypothetical protein